MSDEEGRELGEVMSLVVSADDIWSEFVLRGEELICLGKR